MHGVTVRFCHHNSMDTFSICLSWQIIVPSKGAIAERYRLTDKWRTCGTKNKTFNYKTDIEIWKSWIGQISVLAIARPTIT